MLRDSRILITGATGSWGNALVEKLLREHSPKEIICFSRGELSQVLMGRKFNDNRLTFVIGDVRDYNALEQATLGVDIVFHLAALKHVPICETNVNEAIKTNINGTDNLIKSCIRNKVTKVIDVSTDKAVLPNNLYGMTKSVAEKLTLANNGSTSFTVVRGGNVIGSNGSVVPLFIDQIKAGGPITLTHQEMTRFFLSLDEAIELLLRAIYAKGGETLVMNMPGVKITDLIEVLMMPYRKVDIREIGIRKGEKLHEVLISEHESPYTYKYSGDYWVITDDILPNPIPFKQFDSNTKLLNQEEIVDLLDKSGWR